MSLHISMSFHLCPSPPVSLELAISVFNPDLCLSSLHLSPSNYQSVCPSVRSSVRVSFCLCFSFSVCLSVCQSMHPCLFLPTRFLGKASEVWLRPVLRHLETGGNVTTEIRAKWKEAQRSMALSAPLASKHVADARSLDLHHVRSRFRPGDPNACLVGL